MTYKLTHVLAVLCAALVLATAAAHVLTLPHVMRLSQADYYAARHAVVGWDGRIWPHLALLALTAALAFSAPSSAQRGLAAASFACVFVALTILAIWVMPGNAATAGWTITSFSWRLLRMRCEYGFAASAAADLTALCALMGAAMLAQPSASPEAAGDPQSGAEKQQRGSDPARA